MPPHNNRAKVFAELDEQPVKDYDPEGEISQDDGGSDSDSQESVDENAGTEHYVSVGCVPLDRSVTRHVYVLMVYQKEQAPTKGRARARTSISWLEGQQSRTARNKR